MHHACKKKKHQENKTPIHVKASYKLKKIVLQFTLNHRKNGIFFNLNLTLD